MTEELTGNSARTADIARTRNLVMLRMDTASAAVRRGTRLIFAKRIYVGQRHTVMR